MLHRRRFLALGAASPFGSLAVLGSPSSGSAINSAASGLEMLMRQRGGWDPAFYRRLLGAANEPKEGDAIVGVAAADDAERQAARQTLLATRIGTIDQHPPFSDDLLQVINAAVNSQKQGELANWTFAELKSALLSYPEADLHSLRQGLTSDVIAVVVRLMSNEELIRLGARLFNPLPGSKIGARGYMGARIQPNSPTDHPDDIRWQVFDAFAYAVGDILVGTNPVSSEPQSVLAVQNCLSDILQTFQLTEILPHCVLSHIDVQAAVESAAPGSTALWFQSIAGNDSANQTFDVTIEKMRRHASARRGRFGLYFETGQGADFTNGHGHGVDMVIFESRKYGFARALTADVSKALKTAGSTFQPWVHLNDVAGFIGPEVFRSREQLVRCCLEDIAMGKLHGLTIGLDICSTLHMDVSLDDLGWCIDQIMPANPAYIMALPTRIDPMLGYLTTGYQDHVHIRRKFGYRVDDRMWAFYQSLGVVQADGSPGPTFGDPVAVYLQYCRRRGDSRTEPEIRSEAAKRMAEVRSRGVFLAEGHGGNPEDLNPGLQSEIDRIYHESRRAIWQEMNASVLAAVPHAVPITTRSLNRTDYILHPATGEELSDPSRAVLQRLLAARQADRVDTTAVQIVISDGLNALSLMEGDQLRQLLTALKSQLLLAGLSPFAEHLVVTSGRVRAGYRIGELLLGTGPGPGVLLHIIGERPGTGHHTMSIYMTVAAAEVWRQRGKVDHNITRVVSGIAGTALLPETAAVDAVRILKSMMSAAE